MVITTVKKHLRHVLLWLYDKNNAITKRAATEEIQEVYGQGSIGEATCGRWLKKFRDGDKDLDDLEDNPRSGRPSNLDDDELKRLVEEDPKRTVRELAAILQNSVGSVWNHLQKIGMVSFLFFLLSFLRLTNLVFGSRIVFLISTKGQDLWPRQEISNVMKMEI